MNGLLFTLLLGFVLGLKHAFEADHVIAISTIVTEEKNPLKAGIIGAFWGLGHTTTLLLLGIVLLVFKISSPSFLGQFFEFLVGCMLVVLGVRALLRKKDAIHNHTYHTKPYAIGLMHGLAGSGALVLLVIGSVHSLSEGVLYILFFGIGSVAGMMLISLLLGTSFVKISKKIPSIDRTLSFAAGGLSIIFGVSVIFGITISVFS